jgi:DNA phosphorothioation-dependent restriction protein DptG
LDGKKAAEFLAKKSERRIEKLLESNFDELPEKTKMAVPEWHQKAREWNPEAVTKFHVGAAKGSAEFMDKNGQLKGESKIKLKHTYEFLLLVWPEIEEMLKADPPKNEK